MYFSISLVHHLIITVAKLLNDLDCITFINLPLGCGKLRPYSKPRPQQRGSQNWWSSPHYTRRPGYWLISLLCHLPFDPRPNGKLHYPPFSTLSPSHLTVNITVYQHFCATCIMVSNQFSYRWSFHQTFAHVLHL